MQADYLYIFRIIGKYYIISLKTLQRSFLSEPDRNTILYNCQRNDSPTGVSSMVNFFYTLAERTSNLSRNVKRREKKEA